MSEITQPDPQTNAGDENDSKAADQRDVPAVITEDGCRYLEDTKLNKYSLYQETDVYKQSCHLFKLLKFAGLYYNRYYPGHGKWPVIYLRKHFSF